MDRDSCGGYFSLLSPSKVSGWGRTSLWGIVVLQIPERVSYIDNVT